MLRNVRSYAILTLVLALLCPLLFSQRGAITLQRTLPELVAQSGVIVRGHVVSAHVEPHPQYANLMTVVVTISAEVSLKGNPGASFTFRQYIWDERDVMQAAGYRKGQEWLLLMNPVNSNGLTSPVALEQGRFQVFRNTAGAVTVANGRANAGLFTGAAAQAQRSKGTFTNRAMQMMRTPSKGPVALQDLEDAIRGFVGANQ